MVSCLQPDVYSAFVNDECQDRVYALAPGEGYRPQSVFTSEDKAFPYLFPHGTQYFNDKRPQKIGLNSYFNSCLFSADSRFAQDPQYIFYSQFTSELHQINSSISIAI